jgi:hypothetical protein
MLILILIFKNELDELLDTQLLTYALLCMHINILDRDRGC